MVLPMTRRQHAALSVVILLGFILICYIVLIAPAVSSHNAFLTRLEDLQFQYTRFTGSIGRADLINKELAELKTNQLDQLGFLEEKQSALAAADLQRLLTTMVSTHGGELISTSVVANTGAQGAFPEVTIKIHVRAGIEALQKLLYQINSSNPVMVMDNLQIQLRNAGRRSRRSQAEIDQLEIQFNVSSYVYQSMTT